MEFITNGRTYTIMINNKKSKSNFKREKQIKTELKSRNNLPLDFTQSIEKKRRKELEDEI